MESRYYFVNLLFTKGIGLTDFSRYLRFTNTQPFCKHVFVMAEK